MTSPPTTIVWLRDDLRLADNPALTAAVEREGRVVVLYVLDEVSRGVRALGAASRWWLHHSLSVLGAALAERDGSLTIREGDAASVLAKVIEETGANAICWNRRYGAVRETDALIKATLRDRGLAVRSFHASLLFEPWTVTTAEGNPYRVFTPFWRACRERGIERVPLEAPNSVDGVELPSDSVDLLPTRPDWAAGLRESWVPGESSAHERLEKFASGALGNYHRRDEPAVEATSGLSPHLRFGEISPLQVWHRIELGALDAAARANAAKFLSELGWREFNWNILYHQTELATRNYRAEFDRFPWRPMTKDAVADLKAWQQGRTGIPLVDAGMRELWHTGTMHNRVRMVAASFLVKNLLIDWRLGEQWFWDTLVDADEASNPANWQWVAGSGADAAPYFRVFNPVLQAEKFDADGEYRARWLRAPGYPEPIVDLAQSRRDALAAYDAVKATR